MMRKGFPVPSTSWVASILANSPLALVFCGSALFLLGASRGIPSWSIVVADLPWRIAVAGLGIALIISGAVVGSLARKARRPPLPAHDFEIPAPLRALLALPFLSRRGKLTETQRALLECIEQETKNRAAISQQELDDRFSRNFEVYWRMETLCYLGFCEKEVTGRQGAYDVHSYRLSPEYRRALRNEKPPE